MAQHRDLSASGGLGLRRNFETAFRQTGADATLEAQIGPVGRPFLEPGIVEGFEILGCGSGKIGQRATSGCATLEHAPVNMGYTGIP